MPSGRARSRRRWRGHGRHSRWQRPLAAQNRKARHDYFIEDTLEAGIILAGTEVKALRGGKASIGEAFAGEFGDVEIGQPVPEPDVRRQRSLRLHADQVLDYLGRGHRREPRARVARR